MRATTRLLVGVGFFCAATAPAAEPSCPDLHSAVQIAITQKKNLELKGKELEKEFEKFVAADIQDQADEGLMESLNRNAAKKTLFAKKRLREAVQKKERTIATLSEIYCKRCTPAADVNRQEFCNACPEHKSCEAPDL